MSAIQAIIQTYLRFSDERALLALKAHRLKLLASIDEKNPFFRNLRSQCREEISAIEEGLAKFHKPIPTVNETVLADVLSSPSASPAPQAEEKDSGLFETPSWQAIEATDDRSSPYRSVLPPNNFVSSGGHRTSLFDSVASQDEPAPFLQSAGRLGASDAEAQPGARSGTEPFAPATNAEASSSSETNQAEGEFPEDSAGMTIASSLIESWLLRLQDEPNQVELDCSFRSSGIVEFGQSLVAPIQARLFAGLHSFTDITFSQGRDT